MKTLVAYSTLTGNTKMVAKSIFDTIKGEKELICLNENNNIDTDKFDTIIVGYWVDKGDIDKLAKTFIKSLKNKNLAVFGTLGAEPESDHGKKVSAKVDRFCAKNNKYSGGFMCQGKVDPKLIEKMKKFPLNIVHPLNPERLARLEEAKKHPDEYDLKNAQKYFSKLLYNEDI